MEQIIETVVKNLRTETNFSGAPMPRLIGPLKEFDQSGDTAAVVKVCREHDPWAAWALGYRGDDRESVGEHGSAAGSLRGYVFNEEGVCRMIFYGNPPQGSTLRKERVPRWVIEVLRGSPLSPSEEESYKYGGEEAGFAMFDRALQEKV